MGCPNTCTKRCWQNIQKIYLRVRGWFRELSAACSNPVPKDWKQTLLLCILCSVFSSVVGALLYIWLSQSLQYESFFTFILALTTAIVICIVLVLIHPIRCILTMIIPTLGTKQGRRLLLSTCFMFMAVKIVPNIFRNLKNIFYIIRCISQHSAKRILDSTGTFQNMMFELKDMIKKTTDVMSEIQMKAPLKVNVLANINTEAITNQISNITNNMKKEFETVELHFKDITLLSNRVVAGCFILYVLFSSTWYLRNYLTDIRFDNKYITRRLVEMAQKYNITDLNKGSSSGLIKATGFKMSAKEFGSILFRLLVILVYALLSALIIGMDHVVYQLAMEIIKWVEHLPAMQVTFYINYHAYVTPGDAINKITGVIGHAGSGIDKATGAIGQGVNTVGNAFGQGINAIGGFFGNKKVINNVDVSIGRLSDEINKVNFSPRKEIAGINKEHSLDMTFFPVDCRESASPPDPSTTTLIIAIYCILFVVVFLETYAQRLCRKISAKFYQAREEERIVYLCNQIRNDS